jgi:hypothetical protein
MNKTFYLLLTECIYVFCMGLRMSDYLPAQHLMTDFDNKRSLFTARYELDL